ncbi:preprotein translocase subunit SecE [bacterium]|nr:preprotein translocase subunit SecE [bacterium]
MATDNQQNQSFITSIKTYFKGVKAEWSKVSWPQKQQIIVETGIVIAVVAFFTVAVYIVDIIFRFLLGLFK